MDVSLVAETGRPIGSRAASRLRAQGKIPGVVYGLNAEPTPVSVEWTELRKALTTEAGLNALIDLTVDGNTNLSVVKELQRDAVKRAVTHVDFLLIDRNEALSVDVPLNLVGEAPALEAMKGMIDQLLYNLTIKAKPGTIPTQIDVDVSGIELGTSVRVEDVTLPDGVITEVDPETPIAIGSATRSTIMLQQGDDYSETFGEEGDAAPAAEEAEAE